MGCRTLYWGGYCNRANCLNNTISYGDILRPNSPSTHVTTMSCLFRYPEQSIDVLKRGGLNKPPQSEARWNHKIGTGNMPWGGERPYPSSHWIAAASGSSHTSDEDHLNLVKLEYLKRLASSALPFYVTLLLGTTAQNQSGILRIPIRSIGWYRACPLKFRSLGFVECP